MTYKRCIIFLADGSRPDVFEKLCEEGKLPHCERLFKKTGRFASVTSVFPSTTGPAYLPYLTGCYPGTCNFPGIRWFDKKAYGEGRPLWRRFRSYVGLESFFMNSDLQLKTPTLFQLFEHPVNIFSSINRGSTFKANKTKMSRILYFYYAHLTDHWGLVDRAAYKKLLTALDEDPDFAFVVLPAIDEYAHLSDPWGEKTLEAYRTLDDALGELLDKLQKKNWLDETLISVVSDHGLSSTHSHFGVAHFLEEQGLKVFYYPKIFKWGFDVASMVSGNGMLHLYFKDLKASKDKAWSGRTCFEELRSQRRDLIELLRKQEAIDLMISQAKDGSVVIFNHKGFSRIFCKRGKISYQVEEGIDPLGFPQLPQEMTDRESLHLSFETSYPDVFAQALQIFRSPRSGDLILSAKPGWDLRKRFEQHEHRSTHGGFAREHMAVPFFINHPLPAGPARSVDVFPTILKLMNKEIPASIDGISLI
ncbi:MAG: alkaline phosphatase family protein [Deltaproteobacteria bacterium]|nr:alkaline phosphatase family protein [Deltaproteobacteria bacterium]